MHILMSERSSRFSCKGNLWQEEKWPEAKQPVVQW